MRSSPRRNVINPALGTCLPAGSRGGPGPGPPRASHAQPRAASLCLRNDQFAQRTHVDPSVHAIGARALLPQSKRRHTCCARRADSCPVRGRRRDPRPVAAPQPVCLHICCTGKQGDVLSNTQCIITVSLPGTARARRPEGTCRPATAHPVRATSTASHTTDHTSQSRPVRAGFAQGTMTAMTLRSALTLLLAVLGIFALDGADARRGRYGKIAKKCGRKNGVRPAACAVAMTTRARWHESGARSGWRLRAQCWRVRAEVLRCRPRQGRGPLPQEVVQVCWQRQGQVQALRRQGPARLHRCALLPIRAPFRVSRAAHAFCAHERSAALKARATCRDGQAAQVRPPPRRLGQRQEVHQGEVRRLRPQVLPRQVLQRQEQALLPGWQVPAVRRPWQGVLLPCAALVCLRYVATS